MAGTRLNIENSKLCIHKLLNIFSFVTFSARHTCFDFTNINANFIHSEPSARLDPSSTYWNFIFFNASPGVRSLETASFIKYTNFGHRKNVVRVIGNLICCTDYLTHQNSKAFENIRKQRVIGSLGPSKYLYSSRKKVGTSSGFKMLPI